jgi:hypothetical protein
MSYVHRVIDRLTTPAILAVALASACPSIASEVVAKKTTLVTIPATFEVKAPVAAVWALATRVTGFCMLTGFVPDATATEKTFAALGDAASATVWSDSGVLVATYVAKEKELRVTWEVANGGYLCAKRIVLSPTPTGTKVEYWDRYTDDQANVDETAAEVVKETLAGIAKFTSMAEK